jgi:serine/threonine-protein kinase
LDDNAHAQEKSPDIHPLIFEFGDGQWRSRPETNKFPCIRPDGSADTQTTTQVVSLRPQPQGDLVGEMVIRVSTDECRQKGGVIRIPTVASRSGEIPPAVNVPNPVSIPPSESPASSPTTTAAPSETPSTGPVGPGR